MELNNIKLKRTCLICKNSINKDGTNIYQAITKYSKSPFIQIINNIQNIEFIENPVFDLGCRSCILKINKYDRAEVNAKKIRQEIVQLIEKSNEIYRNQLPDVLEKTYDKVFNEIAQNDVNIIDTVKLEIDNLDLDCTKTSDDEKHKLEIDLKDDKSETCSLGYESKLTKDELENLSSQIKAIDKISNIDKTKYNSTRLPICKICNKVFEKVSELTEHRQTQEHLDVHNKSAKFECGECGKKFTKKYALECHLPIHIEDGDDEYIIAPVDNSEYSCENCDFKTNSHALLKRHKQIHSSLKPFKCPCCDKRFAQSSSINRHLPVHTGEKRFQCDTCGRQFNAHSSFRRHKLIHENRGAKRHECPNCGRKYAHRYNMDAHMKKKHSNIDKK